MRQMALFEVPIKSIAEKPLRKLIREAGLRLKPWDEARFGDYYGHWGTPELIRLPKSKVKLGRLPPVTMLYERESYSSLERLPNGAFKGSLAYPLYIVSQPLQAALRSLKLRDLVFEPVELV